MNVGHFNSTVTVWQKKDETILLKTVFLFLNPSLFFI